MNDKVSLLEALKENKFLIFILLVIIVVSLSSFIYSKVIEADYEDYVKTKDKYAVKDVTVSQHTYKPNEYTVISPADKNLYTSYYNRYIRLLLTEPKKAYSMLSEEGLKHYNNDYDTYLKETEENTTIFAYSAEIYQYKVEDKGDYKLLTIIDTEHFKYRFYIYGVWDYKVEFVSIV